MKFTYKGTKCEVRREEIGEGYSWKNLISYTLLIEGQHIDEHHDTEELAIATAERFIDQIINAAKESGK